jgi:hypothetical protein
MTVSDFSPDSNRFSMYHNCKKNPVENPCYYGQYAVVSMLKDKFPCLVSTSNLARKLAWVAG